MYKISLGNEFNRLIINHSKIDSCLYQDDAQVVHRLISFIENNVPIVEQKVKGINYQVMLMHDTEGQHE